MRSILWIALACTVIVGGCDDDPPDGDADADSDGDTDADGDGDGDTDADGDGDGDTDADGDGDGDVDADADGDEEIIIPPDPALVAPPLDPTVVTQLYDAVSFLFEGDELVQFGVAPGTIKARRIAVLKGRVTDWAGTPLSGVKVSLLDHDELGYTRTRADGLYDIAVNGGGELAINFEVADYLPVQRQLDVPWEDSVWLPDIAMVQLDTEVTEVEMGGAEPQIASGSEVTDEDGTRRNTLLIPAGASAELVLADGTTIAAESLNLRATEYTIGESGDEAMPAELPPTSNYTYAVELSADEVESAGAEDIHFASPLYNYVDNFLGLPVGIGVPVAYFDSDRAAWIPTQDGLIIEVVTVDGGGLAELDVDGDGNADSGAALTELGITDGEREQLGGLYSAGESFWRVPIEHFSPFDANYPGGAEEGAEVSDQEEGEASQNDDCSDTEEGSLIEVQNQVLRESIPVTGTPFALNYRSDRSPGAFRTAVIPLTDPELPDGLLGVELELGIAGQDIEEHFDADPDLVHFFEWDGLDAYGRPVQGGQPLEVRIGYTYEAVYYAPGAGAASFGRFSGVPITGNTARNEYTLWQEYQVTLGGFDAQALGLGGWTLDVHHVYDPVARVLYRGDGGRQGAEQMGPVINTIAGNGELAHNGEDIPALEAAIGNPTGIALGPDGSIYIADPWQDRVRRVNSEGVITTVAGNGSFGFSGDDGPATDAQLNDPTAVAVGPDGSLYIADKTNHVIRRVDSEGTITTVAGIGYSAGYSGDEGPATDAQLHSPHDVAVTPDGTLYIADTENFSVRRVGPDGVISTAVGNGTYGNYDLVIVGGPSMETPIANPYSVAVGPDGSLYVGTHAYVNDDSHRIWRVSPQGILEAFAGTGFAGNTGDGGPAVDAMLNLPDGLAVGADGAVYVADGDSRMHRIRRIGVDGTINTVVGVEYGFDGDGGLAAAARINQAKAVAVDPRGRIYVADSVNGRIRRTTAPMPGTRASDYVIPSGGSELYIFDRQGRHLRTIHATTGATLWEFTYDADGLLTEISDSYGSVTTIEREPWAIIGPYGQQTDLALDDNGMLQSATNPAGEAFEVTHDAQGLLTNMVDPAGGVHAYEYNERGRLISDDIPGPESLTLSRIGTSENYEVTTTSTLGRVNTHSTDRLEGGERYRLHTLPDGTSFESVTTSEGVTTSTAPDGTTMESVQSPEPRWSMQAPITSSMTISTPDGRTLSQTREREVVLVDDSDPMSLETITDTVATNGRISTSVYEAASGTVTMTSPESRRSTRIIDDQGRVLESQVADLEPIMYGYDDDGRLETVSQGTGLLERTTSLVYGTDGFVQSATDPLMQTMELTRDLAGRVTTITMPDSSETAYGYDANGNVTSVTSPGGSVHGFTYTANDLLESYTAPDVGTLSSTTTYSYTDDGEIAQIEGPDGRTVSYDYDDGGRLETVTIPRGDYSIVYNPASGHIDTLIAPDDGTVTYGYDGALVTSVDWAGEVSGSVGFTYNDDLEVALQTVNGGNSIAYTYDGDMLLTGAGAMMIDRDVATGLPTGTTLGTVTDTRTFNALGEVDTYTASDSSGALFEESYVRDAAGRIVELTETVDGTTTTYGYTYDLVGRLIEVEADGLLTDEYTYDDNGNRLNHNGTTGTYDAQDRLTSYGSATYAHTDNGALMTRTDGGDVTSYTYDVLGNLMDVTVADGRGISYAIDGRTRRVGRRVDGTLTQGFLYKDELNPVAELDGSNAVVSRFVYADRGHVPAYMVRGGSTYRIISDQLGSVRLVVDTATDAVVQRMDYDAFGRVLFDTNPGFQPFGFAGGLYDPDTGLVRFGARDYDPEVGRWTTKDPIGLGGGDSNLYAYCGADPVGYFDPEGSEGSRLRFKFSLGRIRVRADYGTGGGAYNYWDFDTRQTVSDLLRNIRSELGRRHKHVREEYSRIQRLLARLPHTTCPIEIERILQRIHSEIRWLAHARNAVSYFRNEIEDLERWPPEMPLGRLADVAAD